VEIAADLGVFEVIEAELTSKAPRLEEQFVTKGILYELI
jgi:hypothetical protein